MDDALVAIPIQPDSVSDLVAEGEAPDAAGVLTVAQLEALLFVAERPLSRR